MSSIQNTEATVTTPRANRSDDKHDKAIAGCHTIARLLNEHAGSERYGTKQVGKRQYVMTRDGNYISNKMEAAALRNFMGGFATAIVG